jgi:membrane-bound lytic murein transglycosylase MltF
MFVLGQRLVQTALPHTSEPQFSFVLKSLQGDRDQENYVNRMDQLHRLQLLSEVRYVLDIIKEHGKRNGAAADARRLAESIVIESLKANYDPLFVAAVIKSESTFNREAVSKVGAKGLMQIMPDTGKYISARASMPWRGEQKLTDATYNIQLGIAYLKELENYFRGNREHMLMAYNWGPANVANALKNNGEIPESTVKYAHGILSTHLRWKTDYNSRSQQLKYAALDNLA